MTVLGPGEQTPRGGGRVTAACIAQGWSDLDAFLAWDDGQVLRDYGMRARPDAVAGFGLHRHA